MPNSLCIQAAWKGAPSGDPGGLCPKPTSSVTLRLVYTVNLFFLLFYHKNDYYFQLFEADIKILGILASVDFLPVNWGQSLLF